MMATDCWSCGLKRELEKLRLEVFGLKKSKKDCRHYEVKRLAKRCLKYRHELFTFLLVLGVEPANNLAERAILV